MGQLGGQDREIGLHPGINFKLGSGLGDGCAITSRSWTPANLTARSSTTLS